ncbi:MAG: enoyl-CoA hydratase/isomerase family protein [Burkholderiales bacterium]|nr:enoyl-CoA hydratase/isomerase family protein [Burkholderiales bacterium]
MARVTLLPTTDAGICTLRLERGDKANALDPGMVEAIGAALDAVAGQPPRVLVLEGSGRNFCAGFDFTGYEALAEGELLWRFVAIEQLLQKLRAMPCVTIACVQGGAFGAGADMAAACTFRLGLPSARFRFPGFQFGLALGTRSLAALIGQQAAREILLSGEVVDSARALSIGLLTGAIDPAEGFAAEVAAINGRFGRLDAPSALLALRNTALPAADADLADLVRSVVRPGLKQRIAAYRGTA